MERNLQLEDRIFSIKDSSQFEEIALEVFRFQKDHCSIYGDFIRSIKKPSPQSIPEIPFLPISFFKSHRVSCSPSEDLLFKSSGTTGMDRSQHAVFSREIYERSFFSFYREAIGDPENQVILALLPNYLEQGNSSLIYMVERLIKKSNSPYSGFIPGNFEELLSRYHRGIEIGKKIVIFGVSYALLDLAEKQFDLSEAIMVETGGMKGRRREMVKEELHNEIKLGTRVPYVHSEYGMTELLSQGYSTKNGVFCFPPWMQVLIRDTNDPFSYVSHGKTGGINVIDLANLYSCSFVSTQDLGKIEPNGLRLMGRYDLADIRGCNLMVQ
jgi:hypothetical protein